LNKVLETEGLTKHYGRIRALNELTLQIERGTVYGLLGPNGSGKTTTLSIILGVIRQNTGTYHWFDGLEPDQARRRIGALLGYPRFYPYLTGWQNLRVVCDIKNISYKKIKTVLSLVGLEGRKNSAYQTYSTGMKQRLGIAATLLNDPEVLVLDEPTNGLDPQGIAEVRDLIERLKSNERTIILASHLLDEVEKVCTHTAVLQKGDLLASGPVEDLTGKSTRYEVDAANREMLKTVLRSLEMIDRYEEMDESIYVYLKEGYQGTDLNKAIYDQGLVLAKIAPLKSQLEQYFLQITKQQS